jgi:hypothetical protein
VACIELACPKQLPMWSSLPSPQQHETERRRWLSEAHSKAMRRHSVQRFSSHSLLLLIDIELAFCAGAWLSVIVLSQASIEATLRQIATDDYSSKAVALFGKDPELQWLRGLRNEVLHAAEPGSISQLWKLPPENLVHCHSELAPEAKRAVALAYRAVYTAAGT